MAPTAPLTGMKVIAMAAIGPVPHCGMVLREMGAAVLRIERTAPSALDHPAVIHAATKLTVC